MNHVAPQPPEPDPSASPAASTSLLPWLVLWALLTLNLISPAREAMTWGLDSSNYGSYAWMFEHDRQFGDDVIAMTGPFGFLVYGTTYSGWLYGAHLVGDLLLKALFALLALRVARSASGLLRWAWLGAIVIFLPNVGDLFYDFAILTAALWLLTGAREMRPGSAWLPAAALLGFMGLMKGTHALVAGAALGAIVLQAGLERRPARALRPLAVAFAVFMAGWLLAGQHPAHLPGYLRGIWELATGYNDAMGLAPESRHLTAGLLLAGGLVLLHALGAWSVRRDLARLMAVLFLAGFGFLKWKHGFLRADGHVYIYFNYAVLALPALWLAAGPALAAGVRWLAPCARLLTLALLVSGTIAASEFRWGRFLIMFSDLPSRLVAHASHLAAPGKAHEALAAELARHRLMADLPQVRAEVGGATLDFFGYEQGLILLNDLNYHPRPMGGGTFNVFTRHLQQRNDAFIRDPQRRPDFQLVRLQSLDGRLPTADDPLTLTALLHLYTPLRAQRDYLLFAKRPGAEAPRPTALTTVTVRPGEPVDLPAISADQLLLFSIEPPLSLSGKVRGSLYQPPLLEVELSTDDPASPRRFRLAPAMARVPVLLSPLVENNQDLLALFGAGQLRHVRSFRLVPRQPAGFRDEITLTFYSLPAPPAPPDNLADELLTYLKNPLSNREPLAVSTEDTGIRDLYDEPISLVHAPGHMDFPVRPGDQQVMFHYGLMPQAYDPGRTEGVEFIVELPDQGDGGTVVFSQLLQPVTRPEDRGMQWARVFLPPDVAAGRLRLRTGPGPTGSGAWGQSYFARVQIKPGPFDPRQLHGITAEPLPPGFEGHELMEVGRRQVRSFHPPAAFVFPIPTGASHLTVAAGIRPAAYEGENQTNGFEIIAELNLPGGPARELFRRHLDPRQRPEDRGTRTFDITLPSNLPAGSTVTVRASPGPDNDDRWDWAYLATVHFR